MSSTFSYTRTHTATFAADAMRNVLRNVIRTLGLDPQKLINSWEVVGNAAQVWLESGHLRTVMLEFYVPGQSVAKTRIDLPVEYGGSGVDDDMWVDWDHIQRSISKIEKLPASCTYRVLLSNAPGAPHVEGMSDAEYLSLGNLTSRSTGSVVSTPDIVAGLRYWK